MLCSSVYLRCAFIGSGGDPLATVETILEPGMRSALDVATPGYFSAVRRTPCS